jgi:hypothetical protein
MFNINHSTIGPFKKNISSTSTFNEMKTLINKFLKNPNYSFQRMFKGQKCETIAAVTVFLELLNSFESVYTFFIGKIFNTDKPNPAHIEKIKIALYWNLFVFYYNLYMVKPVLGGKYDDDYEKESITYLNHLNFNYFDFCNFINKDKDNKYNCDILNTDDMYDPLYSESRVETKDFTT